MNNHIQEVLQLTQQHLDTLSNDLVKDLNELTAGNWVLYKEHTASEVHLIDIEIFTDGYRLVTYPMDHDLTQLGVKTLLTAHPNGVLSGYDFDLDYDNHDLNDQEIDDFYEKQKELFINWFIQCWAKADTSVLKTPVYLAVHDDTESFDLRHNKWVSDDEKGG